MNRANTEMVVTLVRTHLVALHQANQTGNYSVLRDLGAPDFAAKNTATDLGTIFASLRAAKVDLAPVVLLDPQITQASLTPDKKLFISGALPTKPLPVTFELLFLPVDGVWRLNGISIAPVQDLAAPRAAAILTGPAHASAVTVPPRHKALVKRMPVKPVQPPATP